MDYGFVEPFETGMRQMGEAVGGVCENFNGVVRYIYDHRFQFAPVLLVLKKQLDTMKKGIDQLVGLVKYAVEHHVPVLSLIVQSFRWITQVQTPVSDMSSKVSEPANPDLAYWDGAGAGEYRRRMGVQKDAVVDVASRAAFISEWLMKIATANVKFVVELAKTAVDVLSKFLVVTVKGATVVGIAFALDNLADAVGEALAEGVKLLVGLGEEFMAVVANIRDIVGQVGDHNKLPGGKWPQAVYER
ncbi:hypothetical protein [Actinophytocola algeriensis]|uniref:Uncharacterized protein n=1 Tax=Actinophytocola algeriensis TaxID=1768010 RepID=A0A7W7Q1Q2_9PSEU|nr:hypothetical protein [Actinophytocola algeriensis]MBB4905332.1 hypothetical protein [Actinophytocola algeriensis]MBE1472983.1 hypothetical protein [Actinophytocola algeriensis]